MNELISQRLAGNILVVFMILLAGFHVLVLLKALPSDIVWGGRIKDLSNNLMTMEIIALLVTLIFLTIICAKTGYIKVVKLKKVVDIGVWAIFVYLILNTIGNLTSKGCFESLVLSPITLIMAFFAFRLAIK